MKKIVTIIVCLLLLVGCKQTDYDKYELYLDYYQELLQQTNFLDFIADYDVELVKNKINDGLTRYDVIIDNPRIDMYDVVCLAVSIDDEYNSENMMPSIGIFNETYDLLIDTVNVDKHQAKGLNLSLVSDSESLTLLVIVKYATTDGQILRDYFRLI